MLSLLPNPASAAATSGGRWARRFAFALTPRALGLLALGLAPALAAFFLPGLLWLMSAWDAVILLLAVLDARQLPAPATIVVERQLMNLPTVGSRLQMRVLVT